MHCSISHVCTYALHFGPGGMGFVGVADRPSRAMATGAVTVTGTSSDESSSGERCQL